MRKMIPKIGDTRIKSGFLLFPKTICNELRWFEKACWLEEYNLVNKIRYCYNGLDEEEIKYTNPEWIAKEWL